MKTYSASCHGGDLRKKRKGRGRRPIAFRHSMHLVLRSTQARGAQSFLKLKNAYRISEILKKFSEKYGIKIIHSANSGNHLHIHLQLKSCAGYKPFIRAVTGAIAQAITKASRLKKLVTKFWDQRPFTRIVYGALQRLRLNNYITLNCYEAVGFTRSQARKALATALTFFGLGARALW